MFRSHVFNNEFGTWLSHVNDLHFTNNSTPSMSTVTAVVKNPETGGGGGSLEASSIRRAFGPGRVRSSAMTSFLVSLLTPLPPQWISGAQNGHVNRRHSLPRATLKITKTITGALPNRPDQRTNMSNSILEI